MEDCLDFDSVLLFGELETDKGGHRSGLGICGCGWGCMFSHEELYVPESEGIRHCIRSAFAVLAWLQEEEECNTGEVCDGLLAFVAYLGRGVEGVEDGYWKGAELEGQMVLYIVCQNMSSQKKADGSHFVELGVWVIHGRRYLDHRADVFPDA